MALRLWDWPVCENLARKALQYCSGKQGLLTIINLYLGDWMALGLCSSNKLLLLVVVVFHHAHVSCSVVWLIKMLAYFKVKCAHDLEQYYSAFLAAHLHHCFEQDNPCPAINFTSPGRIMVLCTLLPLQNPNLKRNYHQSLASLGPTSNSFWPSGPYWSVSLTTMMSWCIPSQNTGHGKMMVAYCM